LGEKIVYYRWLKGMTQKELAGQLGVDPTTLAKWERGEREPRGAYRERVISFLDSITLPLSQEMSKGQRTG
jgi:transcriptional regulator with XRE-family HTH domain